MTGIQCRKFPLKKYQSLFSNYFVLNAINKRVFSYRGTIKTELENGSEVTVKRFISFDDVKSFSSITGDYNPIHSNVSGEPPVVHGAFLNGLVSGVIGTQLPGPGSIVVSQTLRFPHSCYAEDTVKINVKIVSVRKLIVCTFLCISESQNCTVLEGEAKLLLKKKSV